MIYTSYFGQLKSIPRDIVPIAICGKAPAWWSGLQYRKLAPTPEALIEWKREGDTDLFIERYYEQVLNKLNPAQVKKELLNLSTYMNLRNRNVVLVCYEKSEDFCHRHLVEEWFNANGINCMEWEAK